MTKYFYCGRALIKNGKKILLVRSVDHWETPGGKLETNENPIQNIHREMKEELGTKIKILNKMPYFYKGFYKKNYTLLFYFPVKLLGKPIITKDNDEVLEIKYFSKKEIMKLKRGKILMEWDAIFLPKVMKDIGL